uniref:LETM1 domain-containing protein n=1 Tax=Panagrellus redivivus TaxID=6233 RepID=A0A7E4UMQ6_PANRE
MALLLAKNVDTGLFLSSDRANAEDELEATQLLRRWENESPQDIVQRRFLLLRAFRSVLRVTVPILLHRQFPDFRSKIHLFA